MVGTPPGSHPPAQHGVANGGGGGDDVGDRQQQDTPKVPARDVGAEALQLFRSLTLQGDQLQSQQQQQAALHPVVFFCSGCSWTPSTGSW